MTEVRRGGQTGQQGVGPELRRRRKSAGESEIVVGRSFFSGRLPRLVPAAAFLCLIACSQPVESSQTVREFKLDSTWAEAIFRIESAYVGSRFDKAAADGSLGQINFLLDSRTHAPATVPPDVDANNVLVQLKLGPSDWITKELDPSYSNHFGLYEPTGQRRYALEERIHLDGRQKGFLLAGLDRPHPVMIECWLRPNDLPTRCQLSERGDHGLITSIYFNGARLAEWEHLLVTAKRFTQPRIIHIADKDNRK